MTLEEKAKEIILEILERHRGVNVRISRVELLRQSNFKLRFSFSGGDNWNGVTATGIILSDRKMRTLIEELRTETTKGAWICSSLDGGYYVANDLKELMEYLAVDRKRGKTIIDRVELQERHARERTPGIQERLI